MEISSYRPKQPITVTIEFNRVDEIRELFVELRQWTPVGGWSDTSLEFFAGLQEAIDEEA